MGDGSVGGDGAMDHVSCEYQLSKVLLCGVKLESRCRGGGVRLGFIRGSA